MGSDYGSHQIFCGSQPAEESREAVIAHLRHVLAEQGYREVGSEGRPTDAWRLLPEVAALLGWHPELVRVGYTHDNEGLPGKYDLYLADADVDLGGFQELYFRQIAHEAEGVEPLFAGMEWD